MAKKKNDSRELATKRDLAALEFKGELNAHHREVCRSRLEVIENAVAAGGLLLKIKAALDHGEYLPWLDKHFGGTHRTAQLYTQASKTFDALPAAERKRYLKDPDSTIKTLLPAPKYETVAHLDESKTTNGKQQASPGPDTFHQQREDDKETSAAPLGEHIVSSKRADPKDDGSHLFEDFKEFWANCPPAIQLLIREFVGAE